jgi:hypothetical protein
MARGCLNVLHDLLHAKASGISRLLEILERQMAGVSMVIMHGATSTGHTHRLRLLSLGYGKSHRRDWLNHPQRARSSRPPSQTRQGMPGPGNGALALGFSGLRDALQDLARLLHITEMHGQVAQ